MDYHPLDDHCDPIGPASMLALVRWITNAEECSTLTYQNLANVPAREAGWQGRRVCGG